MFDRASELFSRHVLTTEEIRENCKDIRVLGPRELKQLVKWREKMRSFVDQVGEGDEVEEKMEEGEDGEEQCEDERLKGIDDRIKALECSEAAEVKR